MISKIGQPFRGAYASPSEVMNLSMGEATAVISDVQRLISAVDTLQAELASAKADQARYRMWIDNPSIALEDWESIFLPPDEIQAKLDAAIASQQEKK